MTKCSFCLQPDRGSILKPFQARLFELRSSLAWGEAVTCNSRTCRQVMMDVTA